MLPATLLLATTNAGKIHEFNQLLTPIQCEALPLSHPPVAEIGLTFIENALIKARAASLLTTLPCLGDDSGLVVPALKGEPGIKSARFAEEHGETSDNLTYLLHRLQSIPTAQRQAYFYCALVYMTHPLDPTPFIAIGTLHGVLIDTPRGQHGFGYDPIFFLPEHNCTLAELTLSAKNQLSHRAQATHTLLAQLKHRQPDAI
jgi:XTP/dITP diphosphohydrolase